MDKIFGQGRQDLGAREQDLEAREQDFGATAVSSVTIGFVIRLNKTNYGLPEIHPPMFCSKCQLVLRRKIAAQKEKRPYKCLLKPYDWFRWVQGMDRSSNCHISFWPRLYA